MQGLGQIATANATQVDPVLVDVNLNPIYHAERVGHRKLPVRMNQVAFHTRRALSHNCHSTLTCAVNREARVAQSIHAFMDTTDVSVRFQLTTG